jgi:hypothetical protein
MLWDDIKPGTDEYHEFYQGYVDQVGPGNIMDILIRQMHESYTLMSSLSDSQASYRYAPGKWTVREVFGHLMDTERIFGTRALCFSRGETQPLPGYDQDQYVIHANFNTRSVYGIAEEYANLRKSNITMFEEFEPEMLAREGTASGRTFSVRSIPFIIAGHERHHLDILYEKYGIPR